MPNPYLSIMVVDDTRFSSAMIGRALEECGYHDIRYAASAAEALEQLDQRPADVMLVDWMMPATNGLELTASVRQLDDPGEHYTYIILLTGNEADHLVAEAFSCGVDDFIRKDTVKDELAPRIMAADRMSAILQRMTRERHTLQDRLSNLEQRNMVDGLTGLGNSRYLRQRLGDALRQLESRGGALCYLLVSLDNLGELEQQYSEGFIRELQYNAAHRLRQLLRPLDVLARIDDRQFGVVCMVDTLEKCTPTSFRRVHEGLNLKPFRTSEGFVPLRASVAMVSVNDSDNLLNPSIVMQQARDQLLESRRSGQMTCERLQAS